MVHQNLIHGLNLNWFYMFYMFYPTHCIKHHILSKMKPHKLALLHARLALTDSITNFKLYMPSLVADKLLALLTKLLN